MTKDEILLKQRIKRALNGNLYTKKYEKTKKGFIMRMYRNMKSRVTGVQQKNPHLYVGLPLIERSEFYKIALNSDGFNNLFSAWTNSGYKRTICPSIDRIDPELGYTKENIRFITWEDNYRSARRRLKDGSLVKSNYTIENGKIY